MGVKESCAWWYIVESLREEGLHRIRAGRLAIDDGLARAFDDLRMPVFLQIGIHEIICLVYFGAFILRGCDFQRL